MMCLHVPLEQVLDSEGISARRRRAAEGAWRTRAGSQKCATRAARGGVARAHVRCRRRLRAQRAAARAARPAHPYFALSTVRYREVDLHFKPSLV